MDLSLAAAGFGVGILVGLTGVGGGSLMTPFLIFYGVPPLTAVGTDLVYAAATKSGGVLLHGIRGTVQWRLVGYLALGSVPASLIAVVVLGKWVAADADYDQIITTILGVSLILTAGAVLIRPWLRQQRPAAECSRYLVPGTILAGAVIGVLTTLSSVGAGALGAAVLTLFYRNLSMVVVVGTDLAHATLLAAVSGFGHWQIGSVDVNLLLPLLVGSLPGLFLGTQLATRVPDRILRGVVATMLLSIGVAFAL